MRNTFRIFWLLSTSLLLCSCTLSVKGFPRACMDGNINEVQQQVKSGVDIHQLDDYSKLTPLALASLKGHREVVQFLISNKVNVNQKDLKGRTALMASMEKNQFEVAEILLKHGAKLSSRTNTGETALMHAAKYAPPEAVTYLLGKGAKIEETNFHSRSALHLAALNDRLDNMRILIRHGANVKVKDIYGKDCVKLVAEKYGIQLKNELHRHNAAIENTANVIARSPGANLNSVVIGGVALGLLSAINAPDSFQKVGMVAAVEHVLKMPSDEAKKNLPEFDANQFKLQIAERWNKTANGNDFYQRDQIPEKKAAAGRKAFGVPADETLLGLADITVFGSCEEGVAISPKGFYWNSGHGPNRVQWKEFRQLAIYPHKSLKFHIRIEKHDDLVVAASQIGKGQWLRLLLDLQSMLFEYRI